MPETVRDQWRCILALNCGVVILDHIQGHWQSHGVFHCYSNLDTVCNFHRSLLRVTDILQIGYEVGGYPAILEEFPNGGQVVERSSWR